MSIWRRFRWRLSHPSHPRYGGGTFMDRYAGARCVLPTGHDGYCTSGSQFSWENRW